MGCIATEDSLHFSGGAVTKSAFLKSISHHSKKPHQLCFRNAHVADDVWPVIAEQLPGLKTLELQGSSVRDEAAPYIARLVKLQSLNLADTRVSDAGIEHLTKLRELRQLDLYGTGVSDQCHRSLRDLPQLSWVDLGATRAKGLNGQISVEQN